MAPPDISSATRPGMWLECEPRPEIPHEDPLVSASHFSAVPSLLPSLDSRWTQEGPGALRGRSPRPEWSLTLGSGGKHRASHLPAREASARADVLPRLCQEGPRTPSQG